MRAFPWLLLATSLLVQAYRAGPAEAAEDSPTAPLSREELDDRVDAALQRVLRTGVQFTRDGEHAGAYYLYGGALLALEQFLDHRPHLKDVIHKGLEEARERTTNEGRAGALRRAIDQIKAAVEPPPPPPIGEGKTLWERLGGRPNVTKFIDHFIDACIADPKVNFSRNRKYDLTGTKLADLKRKMVQLASAVSGGPDSHPGKGMQAVHKGMRITDAEFDAMLVHLNTALLRHDVKGKDVAQVMGMMGLLRKLIVEVPEGQEVKPVREKTFWERLGGEEKVKKIVSEFIDACIADRKVNFDRDGKYQMDAQKVRDLKQKVVQLASAVGGGPFKYDGKDMEEAHDKMGITDDEFDAMLVHLRIVLVRNEVQREDVDKVMSVVEATRPKFVKKKTAGPGPRSPQSRGNDPGQDTEKNALPPRARPTAEPRPRDPGQTPVPRGLVVAPATELFAFVPADTQALVRVDLRQVVDAPLFQNHVRDACKTALKDTGPRKFLADAGLDPLRDLDSATLAGGGGPNPRALFVVRGQFDSDKVAAVLAAEGRKDSKFKIGREGRWTIYQSGGPTEPLFTAFPGKGVLVGSNDKDYLLRALNSTEPPRLNPELLAAVDKVNGRAAVWLAAIVTDEMRKEMAQNPQTQQFADKLKAVTAGLTLTDSLHLNVQILTTDAKAAMMLEPIIDGLKAFLNILGAGNEQAAPIVKEFVENIKVGTANAAVTIDVTVSEEQIKKIANLDGIAKK